jgi:glycosyltransferase involved in cell wall biosynthesis
MAAKTRYAIIVSHPIQHFVHLYRALAKQPGLDLLVIFCSDLGTRRYYDKGMGVEITWNANLLSGYEYVVLPESKRIEDTGFWSINNPSVTGTLRTFRPQVVELHGYSQLTLLRALVWCALHNVPMLLSSDSSLLFRRNLLKRVTKQIVLRLMMRLFSGVITTGDNNEAYYRHYGVPAAKMHRCPFTVDEASFEKARETRSLTRAETRKRYGIPPDAFVVLFVGKLIPLKRPLDILNALLLLRDNTNDIENVCAFFAGDGVVREDLQACIAENKLPAILGGFVNIDVLPSVYAMADVLAFPSDREAYGLSAREAACVGLPLIVSDQIGCVGPTDAARPGENALVFPAGDVHALAEAIALMAGDPDVVMRMGNASLRIADELSVASSIQGVLAVVKASVK